jgi:hypothetical protein
MTLRNKAVGDGALLGVGESTEVDEPQQQAPEALRSLDPRYSVPFIPSVPQDPDDKVVGEQVVSMCRREGVPPEFRLLRADFPRVEGHFGGHDSSCFPQSL